MKKRDELYRDVESVDITCKSQAAKIEQLLDRCSCSDSDLQALKTKRRDCERQRKQLQLRVQVAERMREELRLKESVSENELRTLREKCKSLNQVFFFQMLKVKRKYDFCQQKDNCHDDWGLENNVYIILYIYIYTVYIYIYIKYLCRR